MVLYSSEGTAAKIFSSLTWLEKALVRGDIEPSEANNFQYFQRTLMSFHGLAEYLEAKEYLAKHPVQLELNNTYFSFEEETKY